METTIAWLSKRLELLREIKELEEQLENIGDIQGVRYDRLPAQTSGISSLDDVVIKRDKIQRKLRKKHAKALEEYYKIETYLDQVKPPEVRTIMRLRFIQGRTWEYIGEYMCMDRRTACRIVERYIREAR